MFICSFVYYLLTPHLSALCLSALCLAALSLAALCLSNPRMDNSRLGTVAVKHLVIDFLTLYDTIKLSSAAAYWYHFLRKPKPLRRSSGARIIYNFKTMKTKYVRQHEMDHIFEETLLCPALCDLSGISDATEIIPVLSGLARSNIFNIESLKLPGSLLSYKRPILQALKQLELWQNLNYLCIEDSPLLGEILPSITSVTHLAIGRGYMRGFHHLPRLRKLRMSFIGRLDSDIKFLPASLTSLTIIGFKHALMDRTLQMLPKLQHFSVPFMSHNRNISDTVGWHHLLHHQALTSVDMSFDSMPIHLLIGLNLRWQRVKMREINRRDTIRALIDVCPLITHLSVGTTVLNGADYISLKHLTHLHVIGPRSCDIANMFSIPIAVPTTDVLSRNLVCLSLNMGSYDANLTLADLKIENFKQLKVLYLWYGRHVYDPRARLLDVAISGLQLDSLELVGLSIIPYISFDIPPILLGCIFSAAKIEVNCDWLAQCLYKAGPPLTSY